MEYQTPHPSNRLKTAVYNYRFAESVVEAFVEKYSRATYFVAKKTGMEPKEFKYKLIYTFMYRNSMWNFVRDTIKKVEQWDMYADLSRLNRSDFLKYLTVVREMLIDNWLDEEI